MDLNFDPQTDFLLLFIALVIPLVGYVLQLSFGRFLPRKGDWMLIGGMGVTASITVYLAAKALKAAYAGEEFFHHSGEEAGLWFHWLYSSAETAGETTNLVTGILYDPLGAAMLAVVGVVSFCVHVFSVGYMHGDKRYHLFFANISLFTFAMLGLVLSDNVLFLFVFWEIMGLMSYMLIGHFAHDQSSGFHGWATWASKKAFLTTRVGDVSLLIGILIFHQHFDTFNFTELWRLGAEEVARNHGDYPQWMTVAGLFVFGGTMGKSAQFPLHIWLPDAMAGPTPVSAMIHAATMVAAGVFLLGRMYPLMSPDALVVITVVGATTALFAATIGMTAWDLKGVLAYSTISQLGFMVAAIGLGGVVAGLFHMVTHAFFKACLFLSAGSVIHGCHHEQDMRLMGGLRKRMPITFVCMLICTLAISGVPLFSGFYSKDMILKQGFLNLLSHSSNGASMYATVALAVAACMTTFYMFRMLFLTFFGEYRGDKQDHMYAAELAEHGRGGNIVYHDHGHDDHGDGHGDDHGHAHVPHESPAPIVFAISVLALLGLFGGHFWLMGDPLASHTKPWFVKLVNPTSLYGAEIGAFVSGEQLAGVGHGEADDHAAVDDHGAPVAAAAADHAAATSHGAEGAHDPAHLDHEAHVMAVQTSLTVVAIGVLLALLLYVWRRGLPGAIVRAIGPLYRLVANKYYVDEFVNSTVIAGSVATAKVLRLTDEYVVDGLVNLVGRTGKVVGSFSAWVDKTFVDGAVNACALVAQTFGSVVRLFQTGRIQQYATFAVFGGLVAAAWLILS